MMSLHTQARAVDIKVTTLLTIYAQLELQFKLFRAVGIVYSEYRYVINNARAISLDFSAASKAISSASQKKVKWTWVTLDDLSSSCGIDRTDLVCKLNEWNERNYIELEKKGKQDVFRLERALPCTKEEIEAVVAQLDASMAKV